MRRQENIRRAELVGVELARAGFAPLVPHKVVAYYYDELPEEQMMEICLSLLAGCDYGFFVAASDGVLQELVFCDQQKIPVFDSIEVLCAR